MSKRPSPLTTARSRAYRQRLEQMLQESNTRLAAATAALARGATIHTDHLTGVSDVDKVIDAYVDDWHLLNQLHETMPGVPVPEWVAERWAKADAEAEASIKIKAFDDIRENMDRAEFDRIGRYFDDLQAGQQ